MHNGQYPPASAAYNPYGAPPPGPHIKSEPVDARYMLSAPPPPNAYAIPSLPGPQIHRAPPGPAPSAPTARLQYPSGPSNGVSAPAPAARIPQVDGPSSSSSDSPSPPPSQQYAPPRALHPSLPQPAAAAAVREDEDEEAINSDLDDSDSDTERDADATGGADTDIVFCTYDKASRSSQVGRYMYLTLSVAGRKGQEQMEMCSQRRHDPRQWQGLSLCQVYRVCLLLFHRCFVSL